MNTDLRSLEQKRVAFAWQRVCEHAEALDSSFKDYVNLAKGAPALIMANGLMQTLAFYRSKAKAHHVRLCGDVLSWLHECKLTSSPDYGVALPELAAASSERHFEASNEALEIVRWLRQLADAQAKIG